MVLEHNKLRIKMNPADRDDRFQLTLLTKLLLCYPSVCVCVCVSLKVLIWLYLFVYMFKSHMAKNCFLISV